MLASLGAVAQEPAHVEREDQLRAGYLLNFIKFVDWPGRGPDHWTLCFAGGEGIRNAITAAQTARQPGTSAITLRALGKGDGVGGCQLLYIDADSLSIDPPFDVTGQSLLTVGDARGFTRRGGVIELFAEGNRLRFNINLDNARRAGLRISSSLLQLASHVEENGR
jgi:hypothetical protein